MYLRMRALIMPALIDEPAETRVQHLVRRLSDGSSNLPIRLPISRALTSDVKVVGVDGDRVRDAQNIHPDGLDDLR